MTVLRPKHGHDLASEHIHRGEQSSRSVALIIVGLGRTMVPAAQVKPGCVRLNAWICHCSSADHTMACGGGFKYNCTTSSVFSVTMRSLLSLNVLTRCGFKSCARQIRPTEEALTCTSWAKLRVLQCVESEGVSWVVL